jgi:hypothetical protein
MGGKVKAKELVTGCDPNWFLPITRKPALEEISRRIAIAVGCRCIHRCQLETTAVAL